MNIRQSIFPAFFIITMVSCFKEDEPVMPYQGVITTIYDSVQTYQSYFDFETGKVIAKNALTDWQLGFECGEEGWRIITNSGADWFIHNTQQTDPALPNNMPRMLDGMYDIQGLWPDSTTVGKWSYFTGTRQYTNHVYSLGRLINGSFREIKKIVFREVTDSSYRFEYFEGNLSDTITIRKDHAHNFVYFSFTQGNQVQPEPERSAYDIVFTSYYDLATLFQQTIPYKVGGVLLNVWETESAADSSSTYADISIASLSRLNFSGQRDIPGYRWKSVTVDITGGGSATYEVRTNFNYIFKTAQGNYYKLRFLSYTLDGSSGFPRFEFQQLQ